MTTLEVLKAAYHLLDDPKRWTILAQARDWRGTGVTARDPNAVSWCAAGAIFRYGDMNDLRPLAEALEPGSNLFKIPIVNNGPDGYELIRAAFRKAIAELELPIERAPVETPDRELVAV